MCDKRRRLHSSMTYEEYQELYQIPPRKPQIKPIKHIPSFVPEMDLTSDGTNSLTMEIEEEKTTEVTFIPIAHKNIKKRYRFQSENLSYSFMNFMERSIQRKKQSKFMDERV